MLDSDEVQAKSAWYRARTAGRVQGPLERHHDRWLFLVERVDGWPPQPPDEGLPLGWGEARP